MFHAPLDPVCAAIQPARQGATAEVVPSFPTKGEEKDPERAGVHHPLEEEQNVQFPGV